MRTKEAIEFTIELAESVYGNETVEGYLDFVIETVRRNISIQAEHLENTSRALVYQAEQLKADVETRLKT